ncbi:V-set and immunoglobulin domain-containing protein 4 isoform X3 [Caretta caretta]|uniref:V-set and immunoglobulin domain-containing protein 4 isoform X3 n=1 Tax=Caretta caretta TaxID=8467 RepID=UPI002094CAB7|nr:V-set and immunoglobulin domain-containing protein 4 isoform X3 [Caretta caretta]
MKEAVAGGPGATPVPGFLAKLWALVEDPGSNDVIAWGRGGQSFCILNEQRFAKELLPKYFKHNNICSFIRQLNMYGFRKVIALENGMITAEKNAAIEFQHPFFKQGKANLLENIKRKVSAVRAEDLRVCSEDLQKVLSEVQEMREQQNNMDVRLASMRRENKALWKEVAVLRQKHSQQQKLLSKILQFILSLMRGNYIVGVKRKRSLTDASGASPSKFSRQYIHLPVEHGNAVAISEHDPNGENDTGIIIQDVTNTVDDATDELLTLVHTSGSDGEEIQDFLNCIDASLEELQAMLSGKKFNFGSESFSDTFNPELPALDTNLTDASSNMENIEDLTDSVEELRTSERETGNKAILELTGTYDIEGTWKSSITLPCVYVPSQDFVQQTVIWTLERDQSPATIFRRDSSDDHILLSQYRGRVSVPNSRPGDVSLEIEKLEVSDSGHYTCKVTWRAQDKSLLTRERTTRVNVVKVAVTKPIIRPGALGFTVPKGARTSLTCSVSGSPPIIYRWFKGEPGGNAVLVSNHAVLMFESLQTSDTGKYYCEAENRASSQVIRQSDAVQLTVRDRTKPSTTVLSSETKANTTAMPIPGRDLITTALATGSDVRVLVRQEVTIGPQRTRLPLYLIILIVVLSVAVVIVVVTVVLCRRKTKEDNPYEVTYQNTRNDARRQICSGVNGKCTYEEEKPKVKNYYTPEPMKENDYETINIKENIEYKILVNAVESEYEVGDVQ